VIRSLRCRAFMARFHGSAERKNDRGPERIWT
jgi:hypothetical protein